jgi:hypothetical protein
MAATTTATTTATATTNANAIAYSVLKNLQNNCKVIRRLSPYIDTGAATLPTPIPHHHQRLYQTSNHSKYFLSFALVLMLVLGSLAGGRHPVLHPVGGVALDIKGVQGSATTIHPLLYLVLRTVRLQEGVAIRSAISIAITVAAATAITAVAAAVAAAVVAVSVAVRRLAVH